MSQDEDKFRNIMLVCIGLGSCTTLAFHLLVREEEVGGRLQPPPPEPIQVNKARVEMKFREISSILTKFPLSCTTLAFHLLVREEEVGGRLQPPPPEPIQVNKARVITKCCEISSILTKFRFCEHCSDISMPPEPLQVSSK
jgi:hypothetical protein